MSKEPHERPTMAQVAGELEKMAQTATAAAVVPAAKSTAHRGCSHSGFCQCADRRCTTVCRFRRSQRSQSAVDDRHGSGTERQCSGGDCGLAFAAWAVVCDGAGARWYGRQHPLRTEDVPAAFRGESQAGVLEHLLFAGGAGGSASLMGKRWGRRRGRIRVLQGTGRQLFVLRAEGYRDQEVWFDESSSATQTVVLQAEPSRAKWSSMGNRRQCAGDRDPRWWAAGLDGWA